MLKVERKITIDSFDAENDIRHLDLTISLVQVQLFKTVIITIDLFKVVQVEKVYFTVCQKVKRV